MTDIVLQDYYNRHDPDKQFDEILFRATRTAQSAELNELQRILGGRMSGLAEALFKDGDIIRDARVTLSEETGQARCEAGLIYLAGAVRAVPEATLTVPREGTVAIGIYLSRKIVTELEDPSLYNPAIGSRGEGDPGAARLKVVASWGLAGEDVGNFYPVHTVEEGDLLAKEPPPNLDSVTQALARYDRDSAGGTYVVSGLMVRPAADADDSRQVYTVAEGRARVYGYAVELPTSRRIFHAAEPDYLTIESEPHLSTDEGEQRIDLDRYPVGQVKLVRLTREETVNLTHGSYTGCHDPLPHTSIVKLVEVKQGGLVYAEGPDYKLTAGKVDWSLPGQEPAPHSTYSVTYQYWATETIEDADESGFNIDGAVPGTQIQVDYTQKLPRYDRLCLTRDGAFVWVRGVAAEWNPLPPDVARDLLPLATIHQTWDDKRRIYNDGVRVVPMDDIAAINTRLDEVTLHMAQQRLESDIFTREAGAKKGLFVDPFLNDEMRDQGLAQTGAIVDGVLTLPIMVDKVAVPSPDISAVKALPHTLAVVLEQLSRTGAMLVNPYDAFDPLPAKISLTPAVDRWTEVVTTWASAVTNRVSGIRSGASTGNQLLSTTTTNLEFLREIDIRYEVEGFGPGETMTLTFDGLSVALSNNLADANGVVAGTFRIPPKVPAGSKPVVVLGNGGSRGSTVFIGQGQLTTDIRRLVTTISSGSSGSGGWSGVNGQSDRNRDGGGNDPLAQTFILNENCHLAAIDLWFTAKATSRIIVQIRETTVGFPNSFVLGEAVIKPADINIGGPTRLNFKAPVALTADTEYAFVVMCDDAVTSLALAELGKWDVTHGRYVTAQPYQVGVMLSSSNANTWTAHQDKDLTFRLYKAVYSTAPLEVTLGTAAVAGATDLMLLALADQPSAQSRVEFLLKLPDQPGQPGLTISTADQQPIRLERAVTGDITLSAKLIGAANTSPIVYPGAQLVSAAVGLEGDYISRAVPAGPGSRVRVILDAFLPAGSSVKAQMCADGESTWADLDFESSRHLDNGYQEMIYESPTNALLVRVKLILTGGILSRPNVDNLRVLTI